MKSVTIRAYAKLNLGLGVMGRRQDGFHEIRTIYQTVSLADDLQVMLSAGARAVRLDKSGLDVPAGRQNLAVRAAEATLRELKLRGQVSIRLRKRIPPGSGLGGGSSDAAAVLRALVYLSGKQVGNGRLLHLAASLGSDVPFFLFGGTAVGLGRGEEVYPMPERPRRSCVILFPGAGMDTAEAYRRLRRPWLTASSARPNIESFCSQANGDGGRAPGRIGNDFEPIVFREFPYLAKAKNILLRSGAELASLTGSGTAVFGLFRDAAQARRAAQQLRQRGQQVFLARTVSRREFQASFRSSAT
jgi:4-diphosphocytidyl-2-C-methyl-D-erythritol kinase